MCDDKEGPKGEIEVTPEMIEAGVPHLARYHPDRGEDAEDSVKAIFIAMYRVLRQAEGKQLLRCAFTLINFLCEGIEGGGLLIKAAKAFDR